MSHIKPANQQKWWYWRLCGRIDANHVVKGIWEEMSLEWDGPIAEVVVRGALLYMPFKFTLKLVLSSFRQDNWWERSGNKGETLPRKLGKLGTCVKRPFRAAIKKKKESREKNIHFTSQRSSVTCNSLTPMGFLEEKNASFHEVGEL